MARRLYRFEWFYRPDRDLEWFEHEKTRLLPDAFAREILISYEFSASGVVFSEFCNDHILEGNYTFNPDLPLYRALDFGRTCAALFAQKDSYGRFVFFKEIVLEPSSTTELARAVQSYSADYISHVTRPFDTCDPAGNTISHTANSNDIQILNQYGIEPRFDRIQQCKDRVKEGVSLIKHKLSERGSSAIPTIRISRKGCPTLIQAFQSGYRYKVNRATQEVLDIVDERHPFEDVMDTMRYTLMQFAAYEPPKKTTTIGTTKFMPTKNQAWKPLRG